jgi:hypothetical protein
VGVEGDLAIGNGSGGTVNGVPPDRDGLTVGDHPLVHVVSAAPGARGR